jgi:hypothetical protein
MAKDTNDDHPARVHTPRGRQSSSLHSHTMRQVSVGLRRLRVFPIQVRFASFRKPEEVAAEEEAARVKVQTPSPASDPARHFLGQLNKAVRARNAARTRASKPREDKAQVEAVGFRSLMPLLRKAMVRLHPDAVAASGDGSAKSRAETSMRTLLRVLGALEVLAADPAGTVGELENAMRRRRAGVIAEASSSHVRGSALLGGRKVTLDVAGGSVELEAPADLLAATRRSEQRAIKAAESGQKPTTAALREGGELLLLSEGVLEGAVLVSPGLRARWLELAAGFTVSICQALELPGVIDASVRLSGTVARLLKHGGSDAEPEGGRKRALVPEAARIGLEGARNRERMNERELVMRAIVDRPAQSLGKIFPNPRQPLDQERLSDARTRDEVVDLLVLRPGRVSASFVGDEKFRVGRKTLVVVLHEFFEALQLFDPHWLLVRFVIGAGYDWEASTSTVYLPWDMKTREAAAFLRDLAPELLSTARTRAKEDLAAARRRRGDLDEVRRLRKELHRQESVRRSRGGATEPSVEDPGDDDGVSPPPPQAEEDDRARIFESHFASVAQPDLPSSNAPAEAPFQEWTGRVRTRKQQEEFGVAYGDEPRRKPNTGLRRRAASYGWEVA